MKSRRRIACSLASEPVGHEPRNWDIAAWLSGQCNGAERLWCWRRTQSRSQVDAGLATGHLRSRQMAGRDMKRQLHLTLFIHGRGHHEASWRHPASSPLALTDIRYYQDLARRAEAARFDSIFLADQLALGGDVAQAPRTWLEPITALAALATATSRIGLIATASTTYTEPFNLARQFASIDHISNGRAAWNIVTSWLATAAENYGGAGQVSHADRYTRGDEFMAVVNELWDSWAADAVIDDRASGFYARGERIRPVNHRGEFYGVAGPLNMPRSPQGRPVLVQAGSSDTGRRLAAR